MTSRKLLPLIDGVGAIAGKRDRPGQRPDRVIADRGYDYDKYGRELRRRGVTTRIVRRCTEHGLWTRPRALGGGAGVAWLHNCRRLRIRWECDAGLHYAL